MTFDKWIAQADSGYQQRHRMNMDWWRQVWDAAQAATVEECAMILDERAERCPSRTQERRYRVIAAAIRERGGYITPINDL